MAYNLSSYQPYTLPGYEVPVAGPTWPPLSSAPEPHCSMSGPSRPQGQLHAGRPPHHQVHATDPSEYGWSYQGCNKQARVEYWVSQDGVKMDYYYTTGTVKTSMDHPRQGKTQMFRRNLSEHQFERVLANPRQHTGRGYQRRGTASYYRGLNNQ